MGFQDFTSLPPEHEQTFVVYEKTTFENSKKAWTFAYAAGAVVALAVPLLHASESAAAAKAPFATAVRATVAVPLAVTAAVWIPLLVAIAQFPHFIRPFLI